MGVLPYNREKRIASEVFELLSRVIHNELSDPRLSGIQLTDGEMTKDLKIFKLYYYVEGDEKRKEEARHGLESAVGYMKFCISRRLSLRFVPEIRCYFDKTIESAERIDGILRVIGEKNKNDEGRDE